MWHYFFNPEKKRKSALKKATSTVMQHYLSQPFPDLNIGWDKAEIVSLDFETSGLDAEHDQILSYGKVHIRNGVIKLITAKHELIQAEKPIPETSAIIHHITDDKANQGRPLTQVLPELLDVLRGKIMLVHFNKIEQGFLDAACRQLYGSPFIIPTIDTLNLASRVLTRRNHTVQPDRLRLFHLRDDFKLPGYKAQNALNDAITTAELFLVLEAEIYPTGSTLLKDLVL